MKINVTKITASNGLNASLKKAKKQLLDSLSSMDDANKRRLYNAFIRWFDYRDLVGGGDIPKYKEIENDARLAELILSADPVAGDDGVLAFLAKQKIIVS